MCGRAGGDDAGSTIRAAALLLTIFAVVTGFTIGAPYLLPAALLWAAALRSLGDEHTGNPRRIGSL